MMHKFAYWMATVGGVGYAPIAPGTVASACALAAWWLINGCPSWVLVPLFICGVFVSQWVVDLSGDSDPSYVVIDEWVGLWIALASVSSSWSSWVVAFLLFRLLDVVKPWPVSAFERLPGGWGVMLDDVCAGLLSGVATKLLF